MATIGRGILSTVVFEFFEGLRTFDATRACHVLAEDAVFSSPWNEGVLEGREAVEAFLEGWLGDAERRPSFSIRDVRGDGQITHLDMSVSGRFGRDPQPVRMSILALRGALRQIVVRPL